MSVLEETPAYGGTGALAAALAKAQAAFPTIPRDKEVTVKSEKGSYTFKYAPLDSILAAVRTPLADNGLALSQLLDSDADGAPALVTMLLHKEGGSISGRTPIPFAEGGKVQVFGSAITYIRRYALQAMLGIAAEEDDDGNSAAGNQATFKGRDQQAPIAADGLVGTAIKEKKVTTDFLPRESPDGHFLGFRLKDGLGTVICEIRGPMALMAAALESEIIGQRVQVWGSFVQYEPPTVKHAYRAFRVTKLTYPTGTIPAAEGAPEQAPEAQAADVADGSGTETRGTTTDPAPTVKDAQPDETVVPDAAGASSAEPAVVSPGSDQCDSASPYGDNAQCELLAGHKGAHAVLSLAFPEKWTER